MHHKSQFISGGVGSAGNCGRGRGLGKFGHFTVSTLPIAPPRTRSLPKLLMAIDRCWVPTWKTVPILLFRADQMLPFLNRQGERFLRVDVQAGLHGVEAGQHAGVGRRGHEHAVEPAVGTCWSPWDKGAGRQ